MSRIGLCKSAKAYSRGRGAHMHLGNSLTMGA
jgi:hypothetical protein